MGQVVENDILIAPAPDTLALAVETSLFCWVRFRADIRGASLLEADDIILRLHKDALLFGIRFTPENAERRINEVMAQYLPHRVGATWWLGPSATPDDLGKWLKKRGVRCNYHMPGMAVEIDKMRADLPRPEGLRIEVVEDLARFEIDLHPYLDLDYVRGVRKKLPAGRMEPYQQMIARQPRRAYAFVGSLAGKPVGASVLYLDAGVAGLYDVGVLPEARRQGIGAAMTIAPLRFARELGYRYGALQASSMGVPIYERVGFRQVCRISCWYHSKTQQAKDHHFHEQTASMTPALQKK